MGIVVVNQALAPIAGALRLISPRRSHSGGSRRPGPGPSHIKGLLAIVLLTSACGGTVQPSQATGTPSVSHTAGRSAPASLAPVASDDGYLSDLDATTLTNEAEARGLTCEEYSSSEQPTDQVWSCSGTVADGSELFMHATGPDRTHLKSVSAQVLDYDSVKVGTITDYLGDMSALFGRADGTQARTWLVTAFPDAQRDGYVETDIGGSYFQLTFEDTGTSSATFLSVSSSTRPPPPPTPGPLPSGSGTAYFGELQGVPGGWVMFADPGGTFRIAFPGQPKTTGPAATTGPDGPTLTAIYEWASKDQMTTYTIVATDYNEGVLKGKEPGAFLDTNADRYVAAFNGHLLDRSATKVGGHSALDVVITNVKGFVCLRLVIVGDRLYALGGTQTHRCPNEIAGFVGSLSFEVQ